MIRSFRLPRLVLPVVLAGLVTMGAGAALAQDATPAAEVGVTYTPLGFASGVAVPSPADLMAVRFEVAPGGVSPFDPADPTGAMLVVESGAFTIRVNEVEWSVTRGGALEAAMATPTADMSAVMETVALGEEATLEAGDVAWVPGGVSGEFRNDGDEPAIGLAVLIGPGGMMDRGSAATPTAP